VSGRRAQLVLLAAVAVALALVPVAAAYLQLGYHAHVEARADDPLADANATLSRGLEAASDGVPAEYNWSERSAAADAVRGDLSEWTAAVEDAHTGTVVLTEFDNRTADRIARRECPGGPGRAFGRCVARGGVVLQERANESHVVAAAVAVRVVGPERQMNATLVPTLE